MAVDPVLLAEVMRPHALDHLVDGDKSTPSFSDDGRNRISVRFRLEQLVVLTVAFIVRVLWRV